MIDTIINDTDTDTNTDEPFGDEIVMLPGWPGYRTRPGRTGLDYLDTQYEIAHMAGIFLRKTFMNRMYMGKYGPGLLVTWLVAIALWFAFPGSVYICPAVLVAICAGIFFALSDRVAQKLAEQAEEK